MGNKIITISREYGSGGRQIGQELAKRLGIDFYDKEIITMLAQESGLDEQTIKDFIEGLNVTESVKDELRAITPHNYTGI